MTTAAAFGIGCTRYLEPHGEPTQERPPFAREPAALIPLCPVSVGYYSTGTIRHNMKSSFHDLRRGQP